MVRALEAKGYVAHNTFGAPYQYYPVVTEEEFSRRTLGGVIRKYFENSYLPGPFLPWSRRKNLGRRTARADRPYRNLKTVVSHVTH